ncbi:hypothetical protein C5K17_20135, partial [Shigella dysenteriae]
RDEAISVIREYIEIFYNRQRRHSRLGNISPAAFREKYHQMAVLKKRTNGSVRYCQYTSECCSQNKNAPIISDRGV